MTAQQEVIDFLSRPESYGASGPAVEIIETHGSLIFLHGERAYKLKRAIAYAALDFLTLTKRERACHAELRLNGRTAPGIYLEVRSITRGLDGRLAFDGAGEVLDWVVVMRRFPQTDLFEQMALLFEGRPTLFDGIEFSDLIACIDVLYDLAFVLMDLQHHRLGKLAPLLLRAYLDHGDETQDCPPLPIFLSVRAATRCYTLAGSALRQTTPGARRKKTKQALALLRQSRIYLLDHQALGLGFRQLSQPSPLSTRSQP
ncbi:hypothetical protein ACBG90_20785 [Stutzerimonas kunmingensis]|uniref:hypothetical protein n=1 Tax=Stutzerimonas kunmingensis TaxID=1211807 RepID=UPI003524807A